MAHTTLATFICASLGLLIFSTSVISASSGQTSSPAASFAGSSGDGEAGEAGDSLTGDPGRGVPPPAGEPRIVTGDSLTGDPRRGVPPPAGEPRIETGKSLTGDPARGVPPPAGEPRIETGGLLTGDPGRGAPPPSVPAPLPPTVPAPLPPAVPAPLPPAVPAPLPPAGTPLSPAVPAPPATQAPSTATCLSCCKRRSRIIKKRGPNRWALVTGIIASVISGAMILYFLVMIVFNLFWPDAFDRYMTFLDTRRERVKQIATERNVKKAVMHGTVMCKHGIVALFALLVFLKLGWIILQSWGILENAGPELDEIQQLLEAAAELV